MLVEKGSVGSLEVVEIFLFFVLGGVEVEEVMVELGGLGGIATVVMAIKCGVGVCTVQNTIRLSWEL